MPSLSPASAQQQQRPQHSQPQHSQPQQRSPLGPEMGSDSEDEAYDENEEDRTTTTTTTTTTVQRERSSELESLRAVLEDSLNAFEKNSLKFETPNAALIDRRTLNKMTSAVLRELRGSAGSTSRTVNLTEFILSGTGRLY